MADAVSFALQQQFSLVAYAFLASWYVIWGNRKEKQALKNSKENGKCFPWFRASNNIDCFLAVYVLLVKTAVRRLSLDTSVEDVGQSIAQVEPLMRLPAVHSCASQLIGISKGIFSNWAVGDNRLQVVPLLCYFLKSVWRKDFPLGTYECILLPSGRH